MDARAAQAMIDELLVDSRKFNEDGRAYDLLQMYFAGFPLDTLRPLLRSDDLLVQRAAAFIASELGRKAAPLVDDVVPLVNSADRHVQYYAMDVLTVGSIGEHAGKFGHVVRMLESNDDALRQRAMRLVANVDRSQLEAARRVFDTDGSRHQSHEKLLRKLTSGEKVDPSAVRAMIHDTDPLVRRYGAIAAKRHRELPNLMAEVMASDDADLQEFDKTFPDPDAN